MAKGYYDPWRKKSKSGMKILNTAFKTSYKIGKAIAKQPKKRAIPNSAPQGCILFLFFLAGISAFMLLFIFISI
ncbi:hypothetical protein LQ567_18740 [Niabella pedocola]|uniref:DUF5808 domain-containing protein n=1 Tax=Niabella pedocola TaxID=1752077 RepID=A0ABS8PUS8_9BACT|nr:hypothetical protein [Niabella pedocola]MCD2424827.1 hypothetical protein [Niabella pedocola]